LALKSAGWNFCVSQVSGRHNSRCSATFRDWREGAHNFDDLEIVAPGSPVTVTGSGFPERANIQYATAGLFALLGIQPDIGRFFLEKEFKSEKPLAYLAGFFGPLILI
jgi:hypothetical protein